MCPWWAAPGEVLQGYQMMVVEARCTWYGSLLDTLRHRRNAWLNQTLGKDLALLAKNEKLRNCAQ